jgi:hypothetical protein
LVLVFATPVAHLGEGLRDILYRVLTLQFLSMQTCVKCASSARPSDFAFVICAAGSECDSLALGQHSRCDESEIVKQGYLEDLSELYQVGTSVVCGWNVMEYHGM